MLPISKKKQQNVYKVPGIEVEPGPDAFGAGSTSPAWLHECEVRQLAVMEHKPLQSFLAGVSNKRGAEAAELLTKDVEARREAMLKTGFKHSNINMVVYSQIERTRSGAQVQPVATLDLFDAETESQVRRGPGM